MNREAFEKLLGLEEGLKDGSILYQEDRNKYRTSKFDASFINGTWYAYQERQKKIEEVLQQLDTFQEQYWSRWKKEADMMDQGASVAYEHAYWMLKKVL